MRRNAHFAIAWALGIAAGGCGRDLPSSLSGETAEALVFTPSELTLYVGQTFEIDVSLVTDRSLRSVLTDPDLELSAEDPIVAISANGMGASTSPGSTLITARLNGLSATLPVTVRDAQLVSISATPSEVRLATGESAQLTVTGRLDDGTDIDLSASTAGTTYASSDEDVARVSAEGEVTAVSTQATTAAIMVSHGEFAAAVTVTVLETAVELTGIAISPAEITVDVGASTVFDLIGTYSDGSTASIPQSSEVGLQYEADSVSLEEGYRIVGVSSGTSVLEATVGDFVATAVVTVLRTESAYLEVDPASLDLEVGVVSPITVTYVLPDGTRTDVTSEVTYTSDIPSLTLRGSTVLVTAGSVRSGTLRLEYLGVSVTIPVTVTGPMATLVGVELNPARGTRIEVGQTLELSATARYSDGTRTALTVAELAAGLESSNPMIARIDAPNRLVGVSQGTALVVLTYGTVSSRLIVTVDEPMTSNPIVAVRFTEARLEIEVGSTVRTQVLAIRQDGTAVDVSGSSELSLASDDASIATAAAATFEVRISGQSVGTTTIRARYQGFQGTVTAAVVSPTSTVRSVVIQAPSTLTVGASGPFRVIATYTNGTTRDVTSEASLSLSVNPSGILRLSNGSVTGLSAGTAVITAIFSGARTTFSVTVSAPSNPVTRLFFSPSSFTVTAGQSRSARVYATRQDGTTSLVTSMVSVTSQVGPIRATLSGSSFVVEGTSAGAGALVVSYGGESARLDVQVTAAGTVTRLLVYGSTYVGQGSTESLTVYALYASGARVDITNDTGLSVVSSNTNAIQVRSGAVLYGAGPGSAQVTFTYQGVSYTRSFIVRAPAQLLSLRWSPSGGALPQNGSRTARVYALTTWGTDNVTTSTETSIRVTGPATVTTQSNYVQIRGTGNGTGQVTATYRGQTATFYFTAGNAPVIQSLSITPSTVRFGTGDTQQLSVIGNLTNGTTVDLTNSASYVLSTAEVNVVTASSTGLLTGRGIGSATLSVQAAGRYGTVSVTVAASPPTLTSLSPSTISASAAPRTLTLTGTGFTNGDRAFVNGTPVPTTYVSATQLQFTSGGPTFSTPGTYSVQVRSANGVTGTLTLTITN